MFTRLLLGGKVAIVNKEEKAELDKLHGDITTALYIEGGRSSDMSMSARAYEQHRADLLRLFWRFLPDKTLRFSTIKSAYMLLCTEGIESPEEEVTAERVHLWSDLLEESLASRGESTKGPESIAFIMMSDSADRDLARRIVSTRWPGSRESAEALLTEMKGSPQPLASGTL